MTSTTHSQQRNSKKGEANSDTDAAPTTTPRTAATLTKGEGDVIPKQADEEGDEQPAKPRGSANPCELMMGEHRV